jgi:hypothetical protein
LFYFAVVKWAPPLPFPSLTHDLLHTAGLPDEYVTTVLGARVTRNPDGGRYRSGVDYPVAAKNAKAVRLPYACRRSRYTVP